MKPVDNEENMEVKYPVRSKATLTDKNLPIRSSEFFGVVTSRHGLEYFWWVNNLRASLFDASKAERK